MSNTCDCEDAEGVHEHCAGCDCVLNYYESENYCVSCVDLIDGGLLRAPSEEAA